MLQPGPETAFRRSKLASAKQTNSLRRLNPPRHFWLAEIDGRSRIGRRIIDLSEDFAHQLGGWAALSPVMVANVRRAAELVALAEQARLNALREGIGNPEKLARLEGAAERSVRALGLDVPLKQPEPHLQTLAEAVAAGEVYRRDREAARSRTQPLSNKRTGDHATPRSVASKRAPPTPSGTKPSTKETRRHTTGGGG
jgi:hypothetical protein